MRGGDGRIQTRGWVVACGLAALACAAAAPGAHAFTAQHGAAATAFATGFDSIPGKGIGPVGLAFDTSRRLDVVALEHLYRFGPAGGRAADARVSTRPISKLTTGLTFGKDGRLYAAGYTGDRVGAVVELDASDGSVLRTVAAGLPCPTALATDPLSGDLFVSTVGCGRVIVRIADPASARPQVSAFLSGLAVDGLTFAPDGTLYIAHEPDGVGATISAVAGTNARRPGERRPLASVSHADGIALGAPDAPGGPVPFLVVNRIDGVVTKVDLRSAAQPQTDLVVGGSRGDLIAVGPDGCLYATQTDSVLKVTNADGSCRPSSGAGVDGPGGPSGLEAPLEHGLLPTQVAASLTPRRCSSKHRIRVRLGFRGVRLRSARVYLDGRRVRTVRGRALRRPVRLRGLPARAFTVTVRARTRGGRTRVRRTRYSACGRRVLSRRPAHR